MVWVLTLCCCLTDLALRVLSFSSPQASEGRVGLPGYAPMEGQPSGEGEDIFYGRVQVFAEHPHRWLGMSFAFDFALFL